MNRRFIQIATTAIAGLSLIAGQASATSVGGNVICDVNGDELIDAGALALEGVVVDVLDDAGPTYQEVTDADGRYVSPLTGGEPVTGIKAPGPAASAAGRRRCRGRGASGCASRAAAG